MAEDSVRVEEKQPYHLKRIKITTLMFHSGLLIECMITEAVEASKDQDRVTVERLATDLMTAMSGALVLMKLKTGGCVSHLHLLLEAVAKAEVEGGT